VWPAHGRRPKQAIEPAPILVSVRSVADHLRSAGFTPGRTERLASVLGELEGCGVLERAGDASNAARRLRIGWPDALHTLTSSNEGRSEAP
jgi:hypothetical protein